MRFKSSEAVMEVITSKEESEEAMKDGHEGERESDVHRCILLN